MKLELPIPESSWRETADGIRRIDWNLGYWRLTQNTMFPQGTSSLWYITPQSVVAGDLHSLIFHQQLEGSAIVKLMAIRQKDPTLLYWCFLTVGWAFFNMKLPRNSLWWWEETVREAKSGWWQQSLTRAFPGVDKQQCRGCEQLAASLHHVHFEIQHPCIILQKSLKIAGSGFACYGTPWMESTKPCVGGMSRTLHLAL